MTQGTVLKHLLAALDRLIELGSRTGLSQNFIRFGMVGAFGFCWDTATVYALRGIAGLYIAGGCGFVVAASVNWALNRLWTYRHHTHDDAHKQWLRFMLTNFIGFTINRGCFFILISFYGIFHAHPVLAIIAGSILGILFNYLLSKRFVFR
jgi:putative flippase GtrA